MDLITSQDCYQTPPDRPRALGDRIFMGSRWWFQWRYLNIVRHYSREVLRGKASLENWAKASRAVFDLIESAGGRFVIQGFDHLREVHDPVVLISNHMSTLETQTLPCTIVPFFPITFVVKRSLLDYPIFGPVMRSIDPIPVGRISPREDFQTVLKLGEQHLNKGLSIVIFPQSTRFPHLDPVQFNSLGIKLAKRAKVKIIPLALKTDFWGNGRFLKDLGPLFRRRPIHFAFGPPMSIEGNGQTQHQAVIAFIQSHLTRWQDEDPTISKQPPLQSNSA